jgi:hypothetical protein
VNEIQGIARLKIHNGKLEEFKHVAAASRRGLIQALDGWRAWAYAG